MAVVTYTDHGVEKQFEGVGNGPIDAVQRGLEEELGINIKVLDYSEHALTSGSGAQAASYIHMMDAGPEACHLRRRHQLQHHPRLPARHLQRRQPLIWRQLTDSLHLHTPSYGPEAPPKKLPVLFYAIGKSVL